jgi:hypothetical protein
VNLERDLKHALLLAAPRELPNLRLFNRPVMRVQIPNPDRTIAVGIKGQCDLYGLCRGGLHIELELKTATGVVSPKQLFWQDFCLEWGIPHLVLQARAEESVGETVKRWCGEIRDKVRESTLTVERLRPTGRQQI